MQSKTVKSITCIAGLLIGMLATGAVSAQQTGIERKVLQRNDLAAAGYESVMARAEISAGAEAGKHIHHGDEIGYVQEGGLVLEVEGKPVQTLKAGDTYFVEAGKAHNARPDGNTSVKLLTVYIVEKGKPLAEPVK